MANQVTVTGHLGADITAVFGEGAQKRALFQIASNVKYTDKDGKKQSAVNWVPCIAWGKTANMLTEYGLKGRHLLVTGSLDCYQKPANEDGSFDNPIIRVRASSVEFLAFEDSIRDKLEAKKSTDTSPEVLAKLAKILGLATPKTEKVEEPDVMAEFKELLVGKTEKEPAKQDPIAALKELLTKDTKVPTVTPNEAMAKSILDIINTSSEAEPEKVKEQESVTDKDKVFEYKIIRKKTRSNIEGVIQNGYNYSSRSKKDKAFRQKDRQKL